MYVRPSVCLYLCMSVVMFSMCLKIQCNTKQTLSQISKTITCIIGCHYHTLCPKIIPPPDTIEIFVVWQLQPQQQQQHQLTWRQFRFEHIHCNNIHNQYPYGTFQNVTLRLDKGHRRQTLFLQTTAIWIGSSQLAINV